MIENKELFEKYKFNDLTGYTWSINETPNSHCFNSRYRLKKLASQLGLTNYIQVVGLVIIASFFFQPKFA